MTISADWFAAVRGCAPSDVVSRYQLGTFALTFHFEMLSDSKRVNAFRDAIRSTVRADDVVLDIGTGSGILALLAADYARHVYAIELDHSLARVAARHFRSSPNRHKLTLIVGNATDANLPEPVDVITCEMMDTVLLNEPQVPIINHAHGSLLKAGGRTIPSSVENKVALCNAAFNFDVVAIRVAHWERPDLHRPRVLSTEHSYFTADFSQTVPNEVRESLTVTGTDDGVVNAVRLRSITHLTPSLSVDACPTLNLPIVVPLLAPTELAVTKGQRYTLQLRYRHFTHFNQVQATVTTE